jgi:RES domain-containing protein
LSALYLALDADTALAEYWQTDPPRPLVLIPNLLTAARVLDIRKGVPATFGAHWSDWQCDWKVAREEFDNGVTSANCASWACGDDAMSRRLSAIVFPSTKRAGGSNVVIFPDNVVAGTVHLDVLDPDNEIAAANPPRLT